MIEANIYKLIFLLTVVMKRKVVIIIIIIIIIVVVVVVVVIIIIIKNLNPTNFLHPSVYDNPDRYALSWGFFLKILKVIYACLILC